MQTGMMAHRRYASVDGRSVWGSEGLLDGTSGASDTIDALDRDQIALHDVHHSVLADSQPVIVTTVEPGGYGLSASRTTAAPIARIPS